MNSPTMITAKSLRKAYRWNQAKETWDPYYLITYQYNEDGNITSEYGMWTKEERL